MARKNRVTIDFKGFEELAARLDELSEGDGIKQGVEAGLKASKQLVNSNLKKAIVKGNLPKHGKYSHGGTEKSIDKSFKVDWTGTQGEIKIGFDFKKSGLTSIMLMYGTPKMKPVKGLKNAIYGNATKNKMREVQEEAIKKVIDRLVGGK